MLPLLADTYSPDIVIANGENAANGFGITVKIAQELFDLGIGVLTSGNHIWDKKDVLEFIQKGKPADPSGKLSCEYTRSGVYCRFDRRRA